MPSLEFDVAGAPRLIELDRPGVVGRDPRVEYVIEHPTISRRHAELHFGEGQVVLVDLGSANGTKLNDEPLAGPRALRDGDRIEFGRVPALFRSDLAPPAPPQTTIASVATVASDALARRLLARDELLDRLLKLSDETSLGDALARAMADFSQLLPELGAALVFDRVSGDVLAGSSGAVPAALLLACAAAIEDEGRARHFGAAERARLAAEHGLDPTPELQLVLELGKITGKPLVLYVHSGPGLDEAAELSLVLAGRALRAVLRHFQSVQVAAISNEDLKLAARIQRRLVKSQPPSVAGYKIALSYTPALAVGGDFYDLQVTPSGELAIIIGDVSGKGVSASLYMAQIMAALRQFVPEAKGPADLLVTMNNWLQAVLEPGLFATMAACFLDPRRNSCRLAQAGHAPPVLRTAARKVIEMSSEPGAPLGAMTDMKPKEQRMVLTKGDLLLFTTDGVEEGENEAGELYGTTRRDAALKGAQGAFAVTLAVRESLLAFVGGPASTDDMTIVAVERED